MLLKEIPEAMKPRGIAIDEASTADKFHQLEAKAAQSILLEVQRVARPAASIIVSNGGDHAADDRSRRTIFRRHCCTRHDFRSSKGRSAAPLAFGFGETRHSGPRDIGCFGGPLLILRCGDLRASGQR